MSASKSVPPSQTSAVDEARLRSNSGIYAAYRDRTPGSATLAAEAKTLLPSGIAHDARHIDPYGIYIDRAFGPHKWDVDGNRYIDYFGGHGALILGHNNAAVAAAIAEGLACGTQFGANHPREVGWAKAIMRLVPSVERVRFTSSGTEATLMAIRLARAFTGRGTLVRFQGHFHGWHDHMTGGYVNHFDGTPTPGVVSGITDKIALAPPGDIAAVEAILARGDVAAIILEPTGASFGQVPLTPAFVHALRAATERHGALLIFDEVISGFRVSPGGAQVEYGIRPDLTSFAKIVAGGLPGAAVGGRRDVLDLLDFAAMKAADREKIGHPGTFNANPVSAAAGIAALGIIAETDVCGRANALAAALREKLNDVLAGEGVPWAAYGTFSGFHLFLNEHRHAFEPHAFDPYSVDWHELKSAPPALLNKARVAMLAHGVDLNPRLGGFTSATHTEKDLDDTAAALRATIRMLRAEGELPVR